MLSLSHPHYMKIKLTPSISIRGIGYNSTSYYYGTNPFNNSHSNILSFRIMLFI